MDKKKIVLKVQKNKANGQKYVNIPKGEDILEDDYVVLYKAINNNKDGN